MDNDLKINNPHDRLFKETLSKKELAQSFLLNYLPQDILEVFEIESLEICKDSFVEKDFEDYFSDLLYKINIKKSPDGLEKSLGYVYILFEHKSYQDKLVLLQILSYMVKIWQLYVNQSPSKSQIYLPIILPIVFYHGKPKWKAPKCFADMFENFETQDKLKNYIPNFNYILCDLANYSDGEIKGHVLLRTTFLLFKNIFKTDFVNELPKIFCLLSDIANQETGLGCLEVFLRYIFNAKDGVDLQDIKKVIETSISENKGGEIMTIAETLINQGYQKGIQEGKFEWLREGEKIGIQKGKFEGLQEGIQKGKFEGIQEGLLDAIELGLSIKFNKLDTKLFSKIKKIKDINKLKQIKDTIKACSDIWEIKDLLV